MGKTMNDSMAAYQKQLASGELQVAYEKLMRYVMALRAYFLNALTGSYSVGNVSPGYMDYTYFPFFSNVLRAHKLRFGIVLNHRAMRFELWLMGQNAQVQAQYWERLKTTKWNQDRAAMPRYSVLEAVLVEAPDFDHLDALSGEVLKAAMAAEEITPYLPE